MTTDERASFRAARCAIAIMAKAPRRGEVKTRLVPPLSPEEATALSGAFIRDVAENILAAARTAPIDGWVAYSPAGSEAEFTALLPAGIALLRPRRSGLGASLRDAAEDLLAAGYGAVCLVNSDSPTLPTVVFVEASQALARPGDRLVLGPAADGGYYLIGLKRPHRRLFEDIDWSTARVLRQTMERAAEIGLATETLRGWYDVDDWTSLQHLARDLAAAEGDAYAARNTAAVLRRFAGRS
ncbi:MAG TPA: TIGR04282 family arsenosugar biosynthesis glycosyltransferase [Stellaceae bacterium]|nr:TIGR04282 family arsenosugar biosynthesis glycosyltransferase [Stellaceae bacterium]